MSIRSIEEIVVDSQKTFVWKLSFVFLSEGRSEKSRLNYFTAQTARELLNKILLMIRQHQEGYTFHSFRRGGCHRAYSRGAALSDIKSLGGWRSDAVEIYLPSNAAKIRVAKTLTG